MTPTRIYTLAEVRHRLADQIATEEGSLRAYGRTHGISAAYLSSVLRGRVDPGPKILATLRLERIPVTTAPTYRSLP